MTDGNTKDWANIRIEEPVRDEARDDPRTYTEIMRAGLRVREDEDDGPILKSGVVGGDNPPEYYVNFMEKLDRIESASTTAEDRTGRIERALEQEGIGE